MWDGVNSKNMLREVVFRGLGFESCSNPALLPHPSAWTSCFHCNLFIKTPRNAQRGTTESSQTLIWYHKFRAQSKISSVSRWGVVPDVDVVLGTSK